MKTYCFVRMSTLCMGLCAASQATAATYRITAGDTSVPPGATTRLSAEVRTDPDDNVVGLGYFSFALDLILSGNAGAVGADVGNIIVNTSLFDDLASLSVGTPQGNQYVGIAAATTDIFAPTFGHHANEVIQLFQIDLRVPESAMPGQTITITPSEGFLESLTASQTFDQVSPQLFEPTKLVIVPEPGSAILLGLSLVATRLLRRSRTS